MVLSKIILIHNNGIVNSYEITNTHQIQFIHNGILTFTVYNMNPSNSNELIRHTKCRNNINEYKAVYLDGVQLVKNSKLITTPWWKFLTKW